MDIRYRWKKRNPPPGRARLSALYKFCLSLDKPRRHAPATHRILTSKRTTSGTITANASSAAQGSCRNGALRMADPETSQPTATDLLLGYAANVDRVLRDGADQMRRISEDV